MEPMSILLALRLHAWCVLSSMEQNASLPVTD